MPSRIQVPIDVTGTSHEPMSAAPSMIRVVLADDQALVRAGFRSLLDAQDDIEVVGEADNGEEAVRLTRELAPDVVLMDIRMPGLDGLSATRRIVADERSAGTRVVILTTFGLDEYVFEAIRSGASGFLVKDTEPEELVQAVRVVASGEALLSPSVTRQLIAEFAARAKEPIAPGGLQELTEREREVVALVGEGLSNEEIADRLDVETGEVARRLASTYAKIGASSRADATAFAFQSRML